MMRRILTKGNSIMDKKTKNRLLMILLLTSFLLLLTLQINAETSSPDYSTKVDEVKENVKVATTTDSLISEEELLIEDFPESDEIDGEKKENLENYNEMKKSSENDSSLDE
jgi:hypothetical protein